MPPSIPLPKCFEPPEKKSLIKYGRKRSVGITFWLDRETKISQIKISEKVLKKKLEKTVKNLWKCTWPKNENIFGLKILLESCLCLEEERIALEMKSKDR
jgi:hypothetical protein